jgi:hypothetical protein
LLASFALHHTLELSLSQVPVWPTSKATHRCPFEDVFFNDKAGLIPAAWQQLIGNSQHLPTLGALVAYTLAKVVPHAMATDDGDGADVGDRTPKHANSSSSSSSSSPKPSSPMLDALRQFPISFRCDD